MIRGGVLSDGYIEVRPAGVSKGLFLEHIVNNLKSSKNDCDFILAIGDDVTGPAAAYLTFLNCCL